MTEPRVPGSGADTLELPCGETVRAVDLDMGLREYECECGRTHAVVVDAHPVSRFVPEAVVDTLRTAIETDDEFPEFGTAHLMGMVTEEFPDEVTVLDVSEDGRVGYALVWMATFDARRLHAVAVELLVELMEHAVSHGDEPTATEFERQMREFDIETFVEAYRRERDFESEFDAPT